MEIMGPRTLVTDHHNAWMRWAKDAGVQMGVIPYQGPCPNQDGGLFLPKAVGVLLGYAARNFWSRTSVATVQVTVP
jgi:hypothetical protein